MLEIAIQLNPRQIKKPTQLALPKKLVNEPVLERPLEGKNTIVSRFNFLFLLVMVVVVPAIGSTTEELLQDTLKSLLVSAFSLAGCLVFLFTTTKNKTAIYLHWIVLLPAGLALYSLFSMVWSHTYLGGVETVRWCIFGMIFIYAINVLNKKNITQLAWGVHIGAVVASFWTALQFWFDFSLFAQGPNPASTFVNRNFFAEFLVCTLPFSIFLLMRLRDKVTVFLLTFSFAFNVLALMMSGTRSALVCLIVLVPSSIATIYLYRKQVLSKNWNLLKISGLIALFIATIGILGVIQTTNLQLAQESGRISALDRAMARSVSVVKVEEYRSGSFSTRTLLWKATLQMIQANPVIGVGAGAWEVHVPRYQAPGSKLETDYYAHNESLQLIAEYGVVGWLFLIVLFGYLLLSAYRTWSLREVLDSTDALQRTIALTSLLMLLLVSNAGFPWRLATTGALFAVSLAILAASDRSFSPSSWQAAFIPTKTQVNFAMGVVLLCMALATYISIKAIECESKIIRAVKLAMTVNKSGRPQDPSWAPAKAEMLKLLSEGIAINPHYRKLTPIVADALATWGDWKNALWIWQSVLASRPNVVALLANITRGQLQTGDIENAKNTLEKALELQPSSTTLLTLQVLLWGQTGDEQLAAKRAKELLDLGVEDPDLLRAAYYLGLRTLSPELAIQALEIRIRTFPGQAPDGWLLLGKIYQTPNAKNEAKALHSYKSAFAAADPHKKSAVLSQIPPEYRSKVQ